MQKGPHAQMMITSGNCDLCRNCSIQNVIIPENCLLIVVGFKRFIHGHG